MREERSSWLLQLVVWRRRVDEKANRYPIRKVDHSAKLQLANHLMPSLFSQHRSTVFPPSDFLGTIRSFHYVITMWPYSTSTSRALDLPVKPKIHINLDDFANSDKVFEATLTSDIWSMVEWLSITPKCTTRPSFSAISNSSIQACFLSSSTCCWCRTCSRSCS